MEQQASPIQDSDSRSATGSGIGVDVSKHLDSLARDLLQDAMAQQPIAPPPIEQYTQVTSQHLEVSQNFGTMPPPSVEEVVPPPKDVPLTHQVYAPSEHFTMANDQPFAVPIKFEEDEGFLIPVMSMEGELPRDFSIDNQPPGAFSAVTPVKRLPETTRLDKISEEQHMPVPIIFEKDDQIVEQGNVSRVLLEERSGGDMSIPVTIQTETEIRSRSFHEEKGVGEEFQVPIIFEGSPISEHSPQPDNVFVPIGFQRTDQENFAINTTFEDHQRPFGMDNYGTGEGDVSVPIKFEQSPQSGQYAAPMQAIGVDMGPGSQFPDEFPVPILFEDQQTQQQQASPK